jgi:geranylgeranyl diphosphate synthase type II
MGADQLGKPVGQDAAHGRPSTAAELGLLGAVDYFRGLMQSAVDSVPACPSRSAMQQLVLYESERLLPQSACEQIAQQAAQQRPALA